MKDEYVYIVIANMINSNNEHGIDEIVGVYRTEGEAKESIPAKIDKWCINRYDIEKHKIGG